MTKKIDLTKYNFGEKSKEKYKNSKTNQWEDLEVWQTPKYLQSKKKAIELIEDGKYLLDEGDFWILKNKGGSKLCYTGLIISHNGCLKINDKEPPEKQFKPSCVSFVRDEGDKSKVMQYINDEQGVFEFGEISPSNCKNDYPYAMVLKRLMDRVILKNSKVGFFGIYSDSESDDFKEKIEEKETIASKFIKEPTGAMANIANSADEDSKEVKRQGAEKYFRDFKVEIEGCGSYSEIEGLFERDKTKINKLEREHKDLFDKLIECQRYLKENLL